MQTMQRYRVTAKGVAPIMMNRYMGQEGQGSKTRDERKLNEKQSGRWKEKVYWSDSLNCVAIPAFMLEACFSAAAAAYKLGKTAKAVLFVEGDEVPLYCRGELITKLEENGQLQLDGRGAVVMRKRVDRWRPIVRDWSLTFTVIVLDSAAISKAQFEQIADRAGKFAGLGDFRPRFGRFETKVEAVN